ncbi:MAG: DUF3795 domain-containing protein [Clostridia bacterium]|nr:DUF3795 domain-containing protein [Clostridia bacterium]
MKKLIGYCGIDCEKCDARIATRNDDNALREKTAKLWSELNGVEILPEMIHCEGCRVDGAKTYFCEMLCAIRKCALAKECETCGDCAGMDGCDTVGAIVSNDAEALNRLKEIQKRRNSMKTNLIQKAERLLTQCKVCTVASVSEKGYPRICVLMPLKTNGIKEFWFSTGASGTKVRHFKSNHKSGVTFYAGGDSVTLTGNMEIVTEKAVKDDLWNVWSDFLGKHFPNGGKDDPDFCVIHFVANEATIYIDGAFETFGI